MEKKYQVFVSSTYVDLVEERKDVIQALLESDCIPVGMEMFQASDEEQWSFIKRVIEECDYYILVIAGRYGSLTKEGISYTEKEFRFAVEKGIPVLAFIHSDLDTIPSGKTDQKDLLRSKLDAFIKAVQSGRIIKKWSEPANLVAQVIKSINHAKKAYPRIGWVKGNLIADPNILNELHDLREKSKLLDQMNSQRNLNSDLLMHGNDKFLVEYGFVNLEEGYDGDDSVAISWDDLFKAIAPALLEESTEENIKERLCHYIMFMPEHLVKGHEIEGFSIFENVYISVQSVFQIKVQMIALQLIERSFSSSNGKMMWKLTPTGERKMIELIALKKKLPKKK